MFWGWRVKKIVNFFGGKNPGYAYGFSHSWKNPASTHASGNVCQGKTVQILKWCSRGRYIQTRSLAFNDRRKGSLQGRIIHCAGCTMGGLPAARGPPPISCQICTTLFWRLNVECTLKRLNVTTTKKGRQLFLGKKCTATDKKILASRTRKSPRLTLVWGPRMFNPALIPLGRSP